MPQIVTEPRSRSRSGSQNPTQNPATSPHKNPHVRILPVSPALPVGDSEARFFTADPLSPALAGIRKSVSSFCAGAGRFAGPGVTLAGFVAFLMKSSKLSKLSEESLSEPSDSSIRILLEAVRPPVGPPDFAGEKIFVFQTHTIVRGAPV